MAYDDFLGALGARMAPDVVDDGGPLDRATITERLIRKGIADIERPRAPAPQAPTQRVAPKAPEPATSFGSNDEIVDAPKASFGAEDQIVDAISDGVPLPRPRPEKAGDGFSASEIPLPKPRPDVGPAPATGSDIVEPAIEAPFRTGGSALDKVYGTDGGMLTGPESLGIKQKAITDAEASLAQARADRKAREPEFNRLRQQYLDEQADTIKAFPHMASRFEADAAKEARLDEAVKREKAAEEALQKAQQALPPTQNKLRSSLESVVRSAAEMPGQVARMLQGGMESTPIPVEAQVFGDKDKAEKVRREGAAQMAKVAERAEKLAQDVARPDAARAEDFSTKLVEGAASMGVFMAGGIAARVLGAPQALGSGGLGALQMGGQQFKEADDALKTLNQKIEAYKNDGLEAPADLVAKRDQLAKTKYLALYAGAGLGATEAIPIERFFDSLNRASKGKVASILAETTAQSLTEYAQEVGQQIGSNVVARLYEENRPLFKDVQESGAVAAILGGLMGFGAGSAQAFRKGDVSDKIPAPDTSPVPLPPELGGPSTLPPGVQTQGGSGGASPAETATSPSQGEVLFNGLTPEQVRASIALTEQQIARMEATVGDPIEEKRNPGYVAELRKTIAENRAEIDKRKAWLDSLPTEPAPGDTPKTPAEAAVAPQELPPAPAATNPEADRDRAVLRAYGYSDQQITDMSAAQRKAEVEDAVSSGIDPDQAMAEFAKQDAAMSDLTAMFGDGDKAAGTKAAPVKVETSADVEAAAAAAATDYSPEQGEANNRPLGHLKWNGLQGSIEVASGGTRRGTNPKTGEPWETTHSVPYGYWKNTIGADKMHVDAYFGPEMEAGHPVYVLDENDPATGKFRQIKTFAGFPSAEAARQAYLGTSSKTPDMIGGITPIDAAEFPTWVKDKRNTTKPASPKVQKVEQRQPKGNLSLMQYLAWRGGIRPDGDIRSMQLPRNIAVPGVGYRSLIRSGGMPIDKMVEAARDGGYLPSAPTDRPDDVSIGRQLLDMLDEESRGRKTFPEGTEATTKQDEERAAEQSESDRDKLMAEFAAAGVPVESVDPLDLVEAERIMQEEGLEPDDAFEAAVMRRARIEDVATEPEFGNIYGEDWWDAVQSDAALQDGAASQEEGVDSERPVAEGRDDAQGGELPGAREDRGEEVQETAGNDDAGEASEPRPTAEAAEDREQVGDRGTFRTAKGSSYVIHEDGTTSRNKAARSDVGHEGDSGPKPRSESTIYLWPEDARRLAQPQGKWRFVFHNMAKRISLATPADNDPNNWGISPSQRDVPFETTPQVGMVPLELWKGEGLKGRKAYSSAHFGNEITEIGAADEIATEQTEAGEQTVLPGAEKIGQGEQAQRDADKPLKPKKAQKPADEGLFGDGDKQTDLIDEIKKAPETGPSDSDRKEKSGWTEIGKNAAGRTLFEDERGVRSYTTERGVRITEPVSLRPTRGGSMEIEIGPRSSDFQTVDEAKPADGIDADVKSAFDDIFAEKEKKNAAPKAERKREFPAYTAQELRDTLADGTRTRNMRPEAVEKMRAELAARESGESQPRRTPQIVPTKTDLAGSAAKKAASGTKKSIEALGALFGGKNKLSSGITFDSETYAKAKPIFLDAVSDFAGAFNDIAELARILVDEVEKAFGWDTVKEMRPYLERFVQDVKDGTIDLKTAKVANEDTADEPASTGSENQAPLENLPSEEGQGTQGDGDSGRGDSGDGEARPGGDREPAEAGVSGPRGGGSRAGKVREPQAGAGRGRARLGARGTGRNGTAVSSEPASDNGLTPAEAPANVPAVNFRITDEVELGKGTEGVKFRDNVAAIQALKTIERENRRATAEEQRALARYVGWGGLANAFGDRDGNFKDGWEKRGSELAELLTPEELAAARRSTRNAHYTSETLVKAMWKAAKQLGFKGGLVLESSVGTGNFLGLIPEDIAGRSRFVGVEYDSLTARIAKALYPQETILHSALQDVPLPDGEFTLNIGNPPFGKESLRFQYKPEYSGHSIHNQFFMAGLDALRADGLQVLVVSRYLMDAQDPSARQALAKKGELLGAIRLPGTAFVENARTEVVTDVVFIRRFSASEEAALQERLDKAREDKKKDVKDVYPDWVNTTQVTDPAGGDPITVNNYFAKRRAMILGSLERSGKMRERNDVTVNLKDGDLATLLDQAVQKLPIDVLRMEDEAIQNTLDRVKTMGESLEIALSGEEPGNLSERDGKLVQTIERETPAGGHELTRREITPQSPWSRDLYLDDKGRWYTLEVVIDEKGQKKKEGRRNVTERKFYEEKDLPSSKRLGEAKFARLKDMVRLRDLVKRQLVLESEDAPAKEMEGNRKKLAAAYKDFVAKHDLLNTPSNAALVADMPDGALVMALEINYRPGMTAARAARRGEKPVKPSADGAPIMERRVVPKYEPATKADTPQDAVQISMSERGVVDIDRVAGLLGITPDAAVEKLQAGDEPLAFFDPESKTWETRDNYLSGQVVKKLKAARNEGLEKNVRALEAVQPEPWTAEQVNVVIGATWVPPSIYAKFAEFLTGGKSSARFLRTTNSFALQLEGVNSNKAMQWGVDQAMTFRDIFTKMLNSQSLKVIYEDSDGRKHVDQEATALVGLKAREIENEFADWVFADGDRRAQLVSIFNEKFNTRVTRQHDGSHLQLPGKVPDEVIALRRHQKNAVWRGIHERSLLLDHVVGAGKTFTAIARIMERRRMGLSRKPMVAVPNHLVEQWAADVYRLYPGAKVLAAGKNQFDKKNRRRLFAKIATGDWDIVIVPHSSFGFIGISPATETRFLENELRIAEEAIKEAQEAAVEDGLDTGRRKPYNVKEAERLAEKIKSRLDAIKAGKTDRLLTFEQMGVDDLTVDEAHEFKNLFYSSRLTGVRGMGDKTGSAKAFGLYNKVRVLQENPTGTVTFMTGTPISNSAVEMYTMMRYLAANELRELGLEHFDAWRAQSVSAEARFEPTESGSGLKEVTRLGRSWSNMRALMEIWYSFTDAVPQEDISKWYAEDNAGKPFPVPPVKHGGRKEVVVKPTPAQEQILAQVVEDFNDLPNITDPDERNATRLRLMDRARKLSLDARSVDRFLDTDEKGGKLDRVSDEVARIHKKWDADKGTQLIFLDRGVKASKADNAILKEYDELVAKRDEATAAGDEEAYRRVLDRLDEFDPNEIEELRAAQRGGWNAYDQIKANLVARGIPAEQIRFIQEANNDAEKKALFDAVNDGTVRVLIGSTPKMGAGTNVQERIVAIHHVDVTWKPSDIEQREGRGIRQGNRLLEKYGHDKFELEILAYVTERTVDAKMWDLNATKLKMINGIRKYDGSFTMDFEDSDSVGMAEIAALASGDPLLLERVKITSEIDKLELQERAHRRKQFGIEDQIQNYKKIIREYPGLIEQYKQVAGQFKPAIEGIRERAASRSVTVEGETYTRGLDADTAFEKAVSEQTAVAREKALAELEEKAKAEGREVTDEERTKVANKAFKYSVNVDGQPATSKAAAEERISNALGDLDPFEAEVEGQTVNRRIRVARLIAEKASEFNANLETEQKAAIGRLFGYDLELTVTPDKFGQTEVGLDLKDGKNIIATGSRYFEPGKEISAAGGKIVLEDLLREVERKSDFSETYMRNRMSEAEQALPALAEQQGKPFTLATDLSAKRQRLLEITRELADRAEDAEKGRKASPKEEQQASIRWQDVTLNPVALERKAEIASMLQSFIRLVAGPQARVEFADTLPMDSTLPAWGEFRKGEEGVTAAGVFIPGQNLIVLALNDPNYASTAGQISTAFHEAFHSVERYLLTPHELSMMQAEDGRLRRIVQQAFGFSDSEIKSIANYEIRAMAFEHYVEQRARGLQPMGMHIAIRRAFERLMQLFRQIRNALRGMGFQTSEDIFESAIQGDIGRRGATEPRTMSDVMRETVPEAANIRAPELVEERRGVAPPPESIEAKLRARNLPKLAAISRSLGIGGLRPAEFRTQVQDKFIRVKNIQKAQERVTGPIPERMDTYTAESLYYGRTGEQIERLDREHIDPLIREIKKRGLTLEQVNDYLYARHAPERNERIREINPDIESPSGMSDAEAEAIIAAIPEDKLADYQEIERRVREIIDQTNATRLRGGLVNEETLEQWNAAYENYVPLRGFAENTEEDEASLSTGRGMDVRGPESRRALGRESAAEGPLYYVILQAQAAIVRAEKDRVGRTMLRYVQANPNPSLWTVNNPETKRVVSPLTGMVVEMVDPAWKTKDNVFAVKVGGRQHFITFHGKDGKEIAHALKNIGAATLHPIISFMSSLTRLFARMQTAWNPEFWVSNFPRDIGEAFVNLQAQDQKRFGRLFLKYLIPAMGGAFKGQQGKFDGRFSQAFQEFDRAGGRIRFFGLEDPDDIKANVESKMRRLSGGAVNNMISAGEHAIEALEIVNGSIENATRLAAYMAARDVGLTQAQAAKIARELTVNFNRKGELGSVISAAYAFANAAMQGTVRMAQAMKSKRVRRFAYGIAAFGALLALYNIGAGGDDDDGTPFYEKIPPWERDKNFILMWPRWMGKKKGAYAKIPLPYGYLPFHILGARIASYVIGGTTKEKAISAVFKSLLDTFDPIGRDENKVAQFAPTITRPGIHIYSNENWTGKPINPVNAYGKDHRPDSERHFDSASKFSVSAAKQMNTLTGGSAFKSGYVDMSPGTIDYMLNFLGGGVGRFVANSASVPWKLYQGEEITADKAPLSRRFVGQVNKEAFDRGAYYEDRDKARDAPVSLARKAAKRGDPGAAEAYDSLSKNATQGDLAGEALFDKVDRQIGKYRAEEKKVREDAKLDETTRKQKIEEIRAEIATLRNNARKTFKEMQQGR